MSSASWRRTFSYASETVFPGIILYNDKNEAQTQIISSLLLQMTLYFNVVFFPVWLVTTGVMTSAKFACLANLYRFISVTVLVAVTVIEILRIYLGYIGNLAERIPEVAGFWMLSILLQLPLQVFLIASRQLFLSPIEYTVQGVMIILLLAQLVAGFIALKQAALHQAKKFHMMQFPAQGQENPAFEDDQQGKKEQ